MTRQMVEVAPSEALPEVPTVHWHVGRPVFGCVTGCGLEAGAGWVQDEALAVPCSDCVERQVAGTLLGCAPCRTSHA